MIANIIIIAYVLLLILGMFVTPYAIGKPRSPISVGTATFNILFGIVFLISLYFKLIN
ncbi:hypothetical protein [Lactococcus lactis]|uniref:hypothetical protein n=1 Tax=Lactococcus lactis TaxID=1358 RepID=UPI000537CA83|nr:hypothetical protein [Lactococcus lactis]KHE75683.1 hypothetical protein N489_13500 [Lactococcus lactis subsp. lactis 1AA59]UBU73677.1 hypothetical protein I6G24_02220 [Lactococcus lactis]